MNIRAWGPSIHGAVSPAGLDWDLRLGGRRRNPSQGLVSGLSWDHRSDGIPDETASRCWLDSACPCGQGPDRAPDSHSEPAWARRLLSVPRKSSRYEPGRLGRPPPGRLLSYAMSGTRQASTRPRVILDSASNERKSERTRAAILDAAVELLWSRPFRELTVADVMSLVGATRPAFYQYFKGLHDLMEDLLQRLGEDVFEATSPWFHGNGDPVGSGRKYTVNVESGKKAFLNFRTSY